MIVCPFCQHRNPEGVSACEACGQSVEHFVYRACPSCGALNAAQSLFCSRCWSELAPAPGGEEPAETSVKPFERLSLPPQSRAPDEQGAAQREPQHSKAPSPPLTLPELDSPLTQEGVVAPEPDAESWASEVIFEAEAVEATDLIEGMVAPSQDEPVFILRDYETAAASQPDVSPQEPSRLIEQSPDGEAISSQDQALPAGPEAADEPLFMVPEEDEATSSLPTTTASPLEGLAEVLPIEASVVVPHRATPPARPQLTEIEQFDAALFQQIAEERASLSEPTRAILPRQTRLLPRVGRALLYCAILLAALTPLWSGGRTSGWVQPRESVLALARAIEELPAGATVLVSFDYGPAYAGEMDALALAVVRHLARRSVRMIVVTTQPGGVGLAERVLRTVDQENPAFQYGAQYVILGYLPGQEAGLRTLGQNIGSAFKVDHVEQRALTDLAVTQGVASVGDLSQLILIADGGSVVRQWIEQVQSQSGIETHALVTSRVEPLLTPYQQAGQLRGLVNGATGAIEYQRAVGAKVASSSHTDSYAALFLLLAIVAVVTNIAYHSQRAKGQ